MNYLNVKYVNTCIKNAILGSEKCGNEPELLLIGDITCTYFDLTNQQMSDKQVECIENLSHKQAWAVMKCLRYLVNKQPKVEKNKNKYSLDKNKQVIKKENNYEVTYKNSKVITLSDYSKASIYIEGFLKHKLTCWHQENNNLSFFDKPKFKKCSNRQIDYLLYIIDEKFAHSLSNAQVKYLSKLHINKVSQLIQSISEMDVIIKDKYNVGKDIKVVNK